MRHLHSPNRLVTYCLPSTARYLPSLLPSRRLGFTRTRFPAGRPLDLSVADYVHAAVATVTDEAVAAAELLANGVASTDAPTLLALPPPTPLRVDARAAGAAVCI